MHIESFQAWLKYTEEQEDRELNESPKAEDGDLEDYRVDDYDSKAEAYDSIRTIANTVYNLHWDEIGTVKSNEGLEYSLRQNNIVPNVYGVFIPTSEHYHKMILELTTRDEKSLSSKFNMNINIMSIKEIIVIPEYRGNGLAKNLYKFFARKLKYTLMSDSEQFIGARLLWSRLSKDNDIIVDIVDINSGEYLEKGAVLHHGHLNDDFDKRVWSKDDSKGHIRFFLIDIK